MLHQNDYMLSEMAAYHQGKLLAEARMTRITRCSNTANKRLRERLFVSMAEVLIRSGQKLKERYEPHYLSRTQHAPQ